MLQNAYSLAKIGADTAENEQHFAEILPKTGNYPTVPGAPRAAGGVGPQRSPRASARPPRPARPARRGAPAPARERNANFWQNFGKMLLVFGCVGTDLLK